MYFFARGLRDRGHHVQVIALDGYRREYDGFRVEAMSVSRSKLPFLANWKREGRDIPHIAGELRELARGCDVAHAHHKFSAIALSQANPARFFVTIRDYWPICICGRSTFRSGAFCSRADFMRCSRQDNRWKGAAAALLYPWFETRMRDHLRQMQNARSIFCISRYVREQLLPFFEPQKLEVLPNFAEPVPGTAPADLPQKFVLYVGRLEENKGPQLLPEILSRAAVKLPIVVVGEGSLTGVIQQDFSRRGLEARFLGYHEYPEMLQILDRSEFVLFPSQWAEPLGRVLIEAAMMGKAAVAFDHPGGHRDIVEHDRTGLLREHGRRFSAAVARLASDVDAPRATGHSGSHKYEREFSPDAVLPRLIQAYNSASDLP